MSKFKLGDEVWDTNKQRGGTITHLYCNIGRNPTVLVQLLSGVSWVAMERHLRLSKETIKKEERMIKDFKVGDLVTFKSLEGAGTVRHTYRNSSRVLKILVEWRDFTESYMPGSLTHYQEPLKYGSGEEVKVGDLIIQRGFVHPQTAQVLRIEPNTIYVKQYGKYNNTVDWGNFHNMELLLRLGELYGS